MGYNVMEFETIKNCQNFPISVYQIVFGTA